MPDDYRIRKVLESLEEDPATNVQELATLVNLSSGTAEANRAVNQADCRACWLSSFIEF
jgi:hypothetical protein